MGALMRLAPVVRNGESSATPRMAIFAQVAVQLTMVTPMSATPLAMVNHIGLAPGSFVISGCIVVHTLSMFLPGLVTGDLIGRVGRFPVMGVGILLQALCMVVTLCGYHTLNFYLGLSLLGLGWNLAFVSSTMLLLSSHSPEERTKVTSFNETFRFAANGCVHPVL